MRDVYMGVVWAPRRSYQKCMGIMCIIGESYGMYGHRWGSYGIIWGTSFDVMSPINRLMWWFSG